MSNDTIGPDDDEVPEPPEDFGHGQGERDPDEVDDGPEGD